MRILVASPIDPRALARLEADHDVITAFGASEPHLAELARDREAIVFRSGVDISRRVLGAARDLRLLVRAGSGLDNLDVDEVLRRRIVLERIPGPGAQAVAELTFALMLGLARQIVVADRLLRQGRWAKSELVGYNLNGKTLGVVGLGSIGTRVAEMGLAWGMKAMGVVERFSEVRRADFRRRGIELARLDDVLAAADFVTVHVPLNARTEGLLGPAAIGRMKAGSFLINVARGGVVDEKALADALAGGRLRGAALDVHAAEGEGRISPLAGLPNVILTPHIGASTVDAQREIGEEVLRIVQSFAANSGHAPATSPRGAAIPAAG